MDTVNFFLDLNDIPRLLAKITGNGGRANAIWTNAIGFKNFLFAHYAKGVEPDIVNDWPQQARSFGCGDPVAAKGPRLLFDGTPVYIDEFSPSNETIGSFSNGSSIYAAYIPPPESTHNPRGGLYGIVPASSRKKFMHIREVLAASTTNTTYRVEMPVGLVLETEDALARLQFRPQAATL